jgi:hypothetical protein
MENQNQQGKDHSDDHHGQEMTPIRIPQTGEYLTGHHPTYHRGESTPGLSSEPGMMITTSVKHPRYGLVVQNESFVREPDAVRISIDDAIGRERTMNDHA